MHLDHSISYGVLRLFQACCWSICIIFISYGLLRSFHSILLEHLHHFHIICYIYKKNWIVIGQFIWAILWEPMASTLIGLTLIELGCLKKLRMSYPRIILPPKGRMLPYYVIFFFINSFYNDLKRPHNNDSNLWWF